MKSEDHLPEYRFTLYDSNETTAGKLAYYNLQNICKEYIPDRYSIEVVDLRTTSLLLEEQVLAVPMVIRRSPQPEVRIIGDLSNRDLAVQKLITPA